VTQVEAGVFTSNGGWSLAVLHPRRLVVYTLAAVGTEQQTAYFSLHKNYEHRMNRTVCNMVYGPFGYNNRTSHPSASAWVGCTARAARRSLPQSTAATCPSGWVSWP